MTFPSAVEGRTIKAAWFPAKTSLYQNEQCPVLLKLYVPKDIKIVNWGFPDAAKINCLAWRFSSPSNSRRSEVQLDNITHNVLTYSTTLSGINPGQATLGPAQLNVHQRLTVLDSTRGYITKDIPIKLTLPAVKFDILSLPHGAPENFNGAVGNFEIDAYCRKTEFLETEPTEVILRVAGIGNLPTIKAPSHSDGAWKIIDTSKITRGEERRSLTGIVTFRQLIRAEGGHDLPKEIPAYSFSYFDPIKAIYQTKTTQLLSTHVFGISSQPPSASSSFFLSSAERLLPHAHNTLTQFKKTTPLPSFQKIQTLAHSIAEQATSSNNGSPSTLSSIKSYRSVTAYALYLKNKSPLTSLVNANQRSSLFSSAVQNSLFYYFYSSLSLQALLVKMRISRAQKQRGKQVTTKKL